jgi:hypothetical protein
MTDPPYSTSRFAFFFGVKADYSPPSLAEENNIRIDTSIPPIHFYDVTIKRRDNFIFTPDVQC